MRIWIGVWVSLSFLLTARAAQAGACAPAGWQPALLTPSTVAVPASGGILVGIQNGPYKEGQHNTNPAVARLTLVGGGTKTPLVAEDLAPGLARYRWGKAKLAPGVYEVHDAAGKSLGKVTLGGSGKKTLAAPKMASVHQYSSTYKPGPGEPGWTTTYHYVTARLSEAPPPRALGLILSQRESAYLFARVSAATRTLVPMYSAGGRCSAAVPKANPPGAGTKVTLAYVDQQGHLSAKTAELTVNGAAPGPVAAAKTTAPAAKPTGSPAASKKDATKAPAKYQKGCRASGGHAPWTLVVLAVIALAWRRRKGYPS